MSIRITMLISIVIATVFIFILLPMLIMPLCEHEIFQPNSKSTSDSLHMIRAGVIECIIGWIFFVCYFIHGIIKRAPEANTEADIKIHYGVFIVLLITYPIATFCFTIFKLISQKKRLITSGSKISTISLIYYCSGLTAITCIAQFITFHSVYITIAMLTTIISVL